MTTLTASFVCLRGREREREKERGAAVALCLFQKNQKIKSERHRDTCKKKKKKKKILNEFRQKPNVYILKSHSFIAWKSLMSFACLILLLTHHAWLCVWINSWVLCMKKRKQIWVETKSTAWPLPQNPTPFPFLNPTPTGSTKFGRVTM